MNVITGLNKALSGIGILTLGYLGFCMWQPTILNKNVVKELDNHNGQLEALYQMDRNCFNKVSILNDAGSCAKWAHTYAEREIGIEKSLEKLRKQMVAGMQDQAENSLLPPVIGGATE